MKTVISHSGRQRARADRSMEAPYSVTKLDRDGDRVALTQKAEVGTILAYQLLQSREIKGELEALAQRAG